MKTRAASASHRASRILTGVTLCALLIAPVTPFAAASEADDAAAQGDIQGNATPLASQLASSANDEKAYQDEHGDAAAFDELPSPLAASQLSREVALQPLTEDGSSVPLLADALAGQPTRFVNQEVSLDGQASVLGSFTVDGMTYAVTGDGTVELVAIASTFLASSLATASDSSSDGAEGEEVPEPVVLDVPESVGHDGITYSVTSIGPRAFAGCDADVVRIPASVASVDEAAFRGSSVGGVEVAEGNPNLASYEGVLYGAELKSLLLIPEGKQGAVRIPKTAEVVPADAFSHCASVTAIEADAGSAAFSSEDGCLYDAEGALLYAPESQGKAGPTTPSRHKSEAPTSDHEDKDALCNEYEPLRSSFRSTTKLPLNYLSTLGRAAVSRLKRTQDVTYHGNGGLTTTGATSFTHTVQWEYGERFTLYLPGDYAFIRDGYYLKGWNRNRPPSGDYTEYAIGYNYHKSPYTDSVPANWYASWGRGYTIKWDARGGRVSPSYTNIPLGGFTTAPTPELKGHDCVGWVDEEEPPNVIASPGDEVPCPDKNITLYASWQPRSYTISFDPQGGVLDSVEPITAVYGLPLPDASSFIPKRSGYAFEGWFNQPIDGERMYSSAGTACMDKWDTDSDLTLYAHWTRLPPTSIAYELDSEPLDVNSKGLWPTPYEPPTLLEADAGLVPLATPLRPGYAFMGWMPEGLPNDDALLAKGPDGTWSLDTAKLPDYADADNLVTLVARWSSVLSVDVPSLATFLYDLSRFDPDEPRTAYAEGGARFLNRSAADLRVSGLESRRGEAADALSLADPSPGGTKVLAAFPDEEGTSASLDAAKGPAGALPAHAVSFSLDDVLLEAAFDPMAWKVPASGMLEVGYRLNLGEGASLDPSALLASGALPDGANHGPGVTIATITYCFALA